MIKHIVIWKLKENALGNTKHTNALLVQEKLLSMKGLVDGLMNIEVGFDCSQTPDSGDLVLYSEFASKDALEVYQSHPVHEEIKIFLSNVRLERRLVDYEV